MKCERKHNSCSNKAEWVSGWPRSEDMDRVYSVMLSCDHCLYSKNGSLGREWTWLGHESSIALLTRREELIAKDVAKALIE